MTVRVVGQFSRLQKGNAAKVTGVTAIWGISDVVLILELAIVGDEHILIFFCSEVAVEFYLVLIVFS